MTCSSTIHTECILAYPLQQRLRELATMLCYTHFASLTGIWTYYSLWRTSWGWERTWAPSIKHYRRLEHRASSMSEDLSTEHQAWAILNVKYRRSRDINCRSLCVIYVHLMQYRWTVDRAHLHKLRCRSQVLPYTELTDWNSIVVSSGTRITCHTVPTSP